MSLATTLLATDVLRGAMKECPAPSMVCELSIRWMDEGADCKETNVTYDGRPSGECAITATKAADLLYRAASKDSR